MKAVLTNLVYKSKDLSVNAFIMLLRNRPMFILQQLGFYIMLLGLNCMQIANALYTGNGIGLLGGLGGFFLISGLLGIKVRRIYGNAQAILGKIGLKREEKTLNENMAKDLEVFEFLFNSRYDKKLRLKIEDN